VTIGDGQRRSIRPSWRLVHLRFDRPKHPREELAAARGSDEWRRRGREASH
jgi:hypothetical protein